MLNIFTHFLTLLRMISGARYSGVPQRVHVLPFTLFANPKSVTYMYKNITRSLEWSTNCSFFKHVHIIACAYASSEITTVGTSHKQLPLVGEVPQPLFWMTVLELSTVLPSCKNHCMVWSLCSLNIVHYSECTKNVKRQHFLFVI